MNDTNGLRGGSAIPVRFQPTVAVVGRLCRSMGIAVICACALACSSGCAREGSGAGTPGADAVSCPEPDLPGGTCAAACFGRECGELDGCQCGECPDGSVCLDDGSCLCIPDCTDKKCGDDGCGGSCGDCESPSLCLADGTCRCFPDCADKQCGDDGCGGTCAECPDHWACENGKCIDSDCVPECDDKECGPDGCGGKCGDCDAPAVCLADGSCLCVPECANKQCGDDGCGNNCGTCPDGLTCTDDVCVDGDCIPNCQDAECGPDGCGGSCGECDDGDPCTLDMCGEGKCSTVPASPCCETPAICNDGHACTTDFCDPELGCVHQWSEPCCGNSVLEEGEECDDGNLCAEDGCAPDCTIEPYLAYGGVATIEWWCSQQGIEEAQPYFESACTQQFGEGYVPLSAEAYVQGLVLDFPSCNCSGLNLVFTCPGCHPDPDVWESNNCIGGYGSYCLLGSMSTDPQYLEGTVDDLWHCGHTFGVWCVIPLWELKQMQDQ